MLRLASALQRWEVRARDGALGHLRDLLFDSAWKVRLLEVDTKGRLERPAALFAPAAISLPDWSEMMLLLAVTRVQVAGSPPLNPAEPVTPAQEAKLREYYQWPLPPRPEPGGPDGADCHEDEELYCRIEEMRDRPVEAVDGEIGRLADFLVDDLTWELRYLAVAAGKWWPGKHVLVAPQWVRRLRPKRDTVQVTLPREIIKESPPYDPAQPVTPDYAGLILQYYRGCRREI